MIDVDGLVDRVVPIPVGEGRYPGDEGGEGLPAVVPLAGRGRARIRAGRRREAGPARPRALRPGAPQARRDRGPGERLRGERRRHAARRPRPARPCACCGRTGRGRRAPEKGDADEFEIDTRRIVVTVDPTAEWRQMYDEAGRLMRDHFWVADMAGVDWAAELARYRPLVDAVGSVDDLVDVLWEVQRRARHLARVRVRRRRGRLVGAARPAGRRPRPHGRRLACGAGAAARDVGAGRAQPAGRPGRRRAGRRRDPRGGRTAGRPGVGAGAAAGRHREPARRADGAHRPGPRRARARCAGSSSSRSRRSRSCATRTGWRAGGRSSPTAPRAGWATCTSRTWSRAGGRSCTATWAGRPRATG